MKKKRIRFNLIENAKDSLAHAVEHLTGPEEPTVGDLKRVILDVTHVVELILKERIRKAHAAFIWENVDKYPSSAAQTIGTDRAVSRLLNLAGIALPDDSKKTLSACRRIRNSIQHFEFEIEPTEARAIVGRMLSFIFSFARSHLELDLETDFRGDDRWSTLIKIYEFWKAHSETLEEQLSKEGKSVCACPSCGARTFDLSCMKCALCGHMEDRVECGLCGEMVWESGAEIFVIPKGFAICQRCIDRYKAD